MDVASVEKALQIMGLIALALPSILMILIVIFAAIPGEQPEKTLRKMLEAAEDCVSVIARNSRKATPLPPKNDG